MTATLTATEEQAAVRSRPLRLREVLNPRENTVLVVAATLVSLFTARWFREERGWPLWKAVALFLAMMMVPALVKWWSDARLFGKTVAFAAALLTVQALHAAEHITQWVQRHVLHRPLRTSNGLLSPANSEWVHFVWNWLVVAGVVVLFSRGMRSWWGYALVAWASLHALEHTYMFVRFLQVNNELDAFGRGGVTAQGLPGVVGRNGWLDFNSTTPGVSFICRLPFVTTADRLDTHAAWNTGEILLLIPAVRALVHRRPSSLNPLIGACELPAAC